MLAIAALTASARRQTSYWRNSETLWNRALACNPQNKVAHGCLASFLEDQRRPAEALEQYRKIVEIDPNDAEAQNNLGLALARRGRPDEAIVQLSPGAAGSSPTWRRPTTTGATSWPPSGGTTRPSRTIGRRWRPSPTLPRPATTSAMPWRLGAGWTRRSRQYRKAVEAEARLRRGPRQPGQRLGPPRPPRRGHRQLSPGPGDQARRRQGPQQPRRRLGRPGPARRGHDRVSPGDPASSPISPMPTTISATCWPAEASSKRRLRYYRMALELKPDDAEARQSLRNALQRAGRP